MVVHSYKPFWHMLRELWWPLLPASTYLVVVSLLDLRFHLEEFNFPVAIVAIMGTVIGLILAFRTNSAYARWWEARTLWGAIVNDSRTWVRQLLTFLLEAEDTNQKGQLQQMAYRQIAWCYALSRSLRDQDPVQELSEFVDSAELDSYQQIRNIPNALLQRQGQELRQLYQANQLELYQVVELERTLLRLTNAMGGCERIKNTIFPTSYSRMVHGLMFVFVFFLPFGLVNVPALGLFVTSLSLAFTFLLIDQVSIYLQDPFSNRPSDTPMLALSRTIEINIKQMLGEENIPQPMEPVEGVLW